MTVFNFLGQDIKVCNCVDLDTLSLGCLFFHEKFDVILSKKTHRFFGVNKIKFFMKKLTP